MRNIKQLFCLVTFGLLLINLAKAQDTATIFPNPFSTHFTANIYMDKVDKVSITIYDRWGRTVDSSIKDTLLLRRKHSFVLGDSCKISGVYFMKIQFGNIKTRIYHLIKSINSMPTAGINSKCRSILIFPNPAKDIIQIIAQHYQMPFTIIIYNYSGTLMKTMTCDTDHPTIDLRDFPGGLYTVLIPESGISLKLIVTKEQ